MQTLEDFIIELVKNKNEKQTSWQEIAELVAETYGFRKSRKYYSRHYGYVLNNQPRPQITTTQEVRPSEININETDIDDIDQKILELKKEKVKLSAERIQNNAFIRRLSREETIKEIAENAVQEMSAKKILEVRQPKIIRTSEQEAILVLSDWHYGAVINSAWNAYNTSIAKERINKVLNETIKQCRAYNVRALHIINLGDLVSGRIHLQLRVQNETDAITQTLEVSEILSEFLTELGNAIPNVNYYSCTDNHSRIEPNKKDSLDLENLRRVIDHYVQMRVKNITFHSNEYAEDIITLRVQGHNIAGLHGDKDKPKDTVARLTNFTHSTYDMVLMAHRHHFTIEEDCEVLVIGNGSLMGTDDYATTLRTCAKPSQTLIIATAENVMQNLIKIDC